MLYKAEKNKTAFWSWHFQASAIPSVTPPQSASGGPTLWPTNGTRSRPSGKSTRPFRSWPCSSFSRCLLNGKIYQLKVLYSPADAIAPCCSGVAVLEPRPEGPLVGPGALPSGVCPLLQSDLALWAGSHTVDLHWLPAGTSAIVLLLSLPVLSPQEIQNSTLNPFPSPSTGDLLHCVTRALCGRQNPSVC